MHLNKLKVRWQILHHLMVKPERTNECRQDYNAGLVIQLCRLADAAYIFFSVVF